jgi:hypothetical protein
MRPLFIALLVVGCDIGRPEVRRSCILDLTRADEAAAFIVACAKAANPLSDEEGEDLVSQCERTATDLYCSPRWVALTHPPVQCEQATDHEAIDACRAAGAFEVRP